MCDKKRMRILAVDDSPGNGDIIMGCFGAEHNVHIATNGPDALALLEKITPDIILLDVLMPDMDGFAVAREIQKLERLSTIPIIFLTVLTDSGEVVKGFEAGASDYITKPFDLAELTTRVNFHLELKTKRDELLRKNEEQRELLHVLTHDLANSFTSIGAFTMLFPDPSPRDIIQLENIRSSVRNGGAVIRMVRDLSSNDMQLPLEAVDLQDCLEESLLMLHPLYKRKDLAISLSVQPGTRIMAERVSLMNSVLNNVLTNAIKFSYEGKKIDIFQQNSGDDRILLMIRDKGVGIREADIPDLFHVQRNRSRDGTSGEKGTGFGMPLVRRFMEAFGGTVTVESRDEDSSPGDHGTLVSLEFRRAAP